MSHGCDPISRRVVQGPMPTLKEFASRVIQSNLISLTDIGDVPFNLVASFLADVPAAQLAQIELHSPAIRPESKSLWKALVLKDFFEFRIPYEKGSIPEPRNWRKVYLMANEARKEKEAAGRAKLRAGYQELENRKANVRMDVNLREPVKKGRFGASEANARRPASSVLSKARNLTKSTLQSFKQPVSASSSTGRKPATASLKPSFYKPPPTAAIGSCSQPTSGQRFIITPESTAARAKERLSQRREVVVPKGVYVAPPLAKPKEEKRKPVRVDFFSRPGVPKRQGSREVKVTTERVPVGVTYPDDLPVPLSRGSPPLPYGPGRPRSTAGSPPASSAASSTSRTSTPVALSPRLSHASPVSANMSTSTSREYSPEYAPPPPPTPPPSHPSSHISPPPAQSRSGGGPGRAVGSMPKRSTTSESSLWIPNKKRKATT